MIVDTMFNTIDNESITIDAPMSSHTSPVFSIFHQPPTNIADAEIPVSSYLPFAGTCSNHNSATSSANNNLAPFPPDNFANLVPDSSCNNTFNSQYDGISDAQILPPSHCQSVGSSDPWWTGGVSVNKSNYPPSENRFVYNYHMPTSNDLSLTLSSSSRPQLHPSPMNNCFNAPSNHQFSEMSCSAGAVSQVLDFSVNGHSNNIDHSRLSSSPVYFNHMLVGSRYLHAAQQILSQVVSLSLGDSDELDCQILKQETDDRRLLNSMNSDQSSSLDSCKDPMHTRSNITKKTELLSILKMVW